MVVGVGREGGCVGGVGGGVVGGMVVVAAAETPALLPNQEIAQEQTSARQIYHRTSRRVPISYY